MRPDVLHLRHLALKLVPLAIIYTRNKDRENLYYILPMFLGLLSFTLLTAVAASPNVLLGATTLIGADFNNVEFLGGEFFLRLHAKTLTM